MDSMMPVNMGFSSKTGCAGKPGIIRRGRQGDGSDSPVIADCAHFGDFQPRRVAHLRQRPVQQRAGSGAEEGAGDEQLELVDQALLGKGTDQAGTGLQQDFVDAAGGQLRSSAGRSTWPSLPAG
jgi:hypothetical protein